MTKGDLILFVVYSLTMYFLFGELFEDFYRAARKKWRQIRFGEEDLEHINVGFTLKVEKPGTIRSATGHGLQRVWKRPGSQLNPARVQNPNVGSDSIRGRDNS